MKNHDIFLLHSVKRHIVDILRSKHTPPLKGLTKIVDITQVTSTISFGGIGIIDYDMRIEKTLLHYLDSGFILLVSGISDACIATSYLSILDILQLFRNWK